MSTYTYISIYIYVCMYVCMYAYLCICTHIYIYIHIFIYIYYMCVMYSHACANETCFQLYQRQRHPRQPPSGPTKITCSLFVLVTPFVRIYNTNRISGIELLHLSENWVCPFKSLSIAMSSSETHLNGNSVLMINLWISGFPCFFR